MCCAVPDDIYDWWKDYARFCSDTKYILRNTNAKVRNKMAQPKRMAMLAPTLLIMTEFSAITDGNTPPNSFTMSACEYGTHSKSRCL
jgi:hypothetical protein